MESNKINDIEVKDFIELSPSVEDQRQMRIQETLEEVAIQKRNELGLKGTIDGFIAGAKWQTERMYSEEDIIDLIQFLSMNKEFNEYSSVSKETARYFLEQFKKK